MRPHTRIAAGMTAVSVLLMLALGAAEATCVETPEHAPPGTTSAASACVLEDEQGTSPGATWERSEAVSVEAVQGAGPVATTTMWIEASQEDRHGDGWFYRYTGVVVHRQVDLPAMSRSSNAFVVLEQDIWSEAGRNSKRTAVHAGGASFGPVAHATVDALVVQDRSFGEPCGQGAAVHVGAPVINQTVVVGEYDCVVEAPDAPDFP